MDYEFCLTIFNNFDVLIKKNRELISRYFFPAVLCRGESSGLLPGHHRIVINEVAKPPTQRIVEGLA